MRTLFPIRHHRLPGRVSIVPDRENSLHCTTVNRHHRDILLSHTPLRRVLPQIIQPAPRRIPTNRLIDPRIQRLHLLRRQAKIIQIRILINPTRRHALWQRHKPLLQPPPQQYLRRRLTRALCNGLQYGLLQPRALNERAVGFGDDAVGLAPGVNVLAVAPRVPFPLSDADLAAFTRAVLGFELRNVGLEFFEVDDAVVGDT